MGDIRKALKEGAMHVGAGGSAGFVEVCIMHPLDLVKTRLQLQQTRVAVGSHSDPHYYTGLVDCMKKMYRYEGVTSFWKGIVPPILAETPKRAVKFATFEQYKKLFTFGETATPLTFSLAGLAAGLTEGLLINPFEVVKVTLQSNKELAKQMPSTWAVTSQIVRDNGMGSKGLFKGLTATFGRNGVFNMVYFGFYHSVKNIVPESKDPILEFSRKFAIGFASGILGSLANIPFDVAKSRIQGPQPTPGIVKYSSTSGTILLVYREEGFRALYKGLLPKVLRLGPGGAIMLVLYDYVFNLLKVTFD
ncbi:unnamed protein product [Chrysodeixis includens]|uniref:Mitochondrial 2-oxodicarboxylate carrier n=1 Tax=Chrysodeixis includens TaxID=689277 RepID=A0A9P0FW50_CHRIL|nr:unnamed protein product [Chrysodeixis includens]